MSVKRHPTDLSSADIVQLVQERYGVGPWDLGRMPCAAYTAGGKAYWRAATVRTWLTVACSTQRIPELREHRDPVLAEWLERWSRWLRQLCEAPGNGAHGLA
jgi:predicted NBD/HSP70 family sugar kinase